MPTRIEHDAWRLVQWPTERAREWTRDLVARHGERLVVVAIGSAARGRARSGSDLDLVVVHRGARPEQRPPPEVEVRWVSWSMVDAALADGDDVLAWALGFGMPLHDPRGTWSEFASAWRSKLPLPSVEVSAQREARARCLARDLLAAGDDDAAAEQALAMLTHRARRLLAVHHVFPLSRPELVEQLRRAGEGEAADLLQNALTERMTPQAILAAIE